MPNGTIGSVVRKNGPLCEWNTKLWFCPIASALKYLHDHKIAHRDLKMSNVLLDANYNCLVADFGLSRVAFRPSKGGTVMSNKYCGTSQ